MVSFLILLQHLLIVIIANAFIALNHVWDTIQSALYFLTAQPYEVGTFIILILPMRKLKHRKEAQVTLAQGDTGW